MLPGPKVHGGLAFLFLLLLITPARAEQPQVPHPFGIETTRVTLLLVDVYPVDDEGRPIEGLTRKDFTVFLNNKSWPISSVDNLCGEAGVPEAEPPAPHVGYQFVQFPRAKLEFDVTNPLGPRSPWMSGEQAIRALSAGLKTVLTAVARRPIAPPPAS